MRNLLTVPDMWPRAPVHPVGLVFRDPATEAAYRDAGLVDLRTDTAGFFPPQVLNAIPATRGLEERIERVRALQWILPFLLMSARSPCKGLE